VGPEPASSEYVVMGNPVAHSLSPRIHGLFAEQTGERLIYGRLLVPPNGFEAAADAFFRAGGRGANVTVPFKEDAASWVDTLEPAAEFAAAVNTIVRYPDGRFGGLNTDGPGLVADLNRLLGGPPRGMRVLVVGAGGAVRGVVGPLAELEPSRLLIANRTPARARTVAQRLRERFPDLNAEHSDLSGIEGSFDLVVNGTSAGLSDAIPDLDRSVVSGSFCYDMVYGADTAFCRWARDSGAAGTADGIGMLVEQAALAFTAWRGKVPETAPVLRRLVAERGGR
jgi:shikimate dehydrogenase